jgi:hypothetical protein
LKALKLARWAWIKKERSAKMQIVFIGFGVVSSLLGVISFSTDLKHQLFVSTKPWKDRWKSLSVIVEFFGVYTVCVWGTLFAADQILSPVHWSVQSAIGVGSLLGWFLFLPAFYVNTLKRKIPL